jgi:hypothetical protein
MVAGATISRLEAMAMAMTDHEVRVQSIRASYAPYDSAPQTKAAFDAGIEAYGKGNYANPYEGCAGWKAQAWDRGLEAGARIARCP